MSLNITPAVAINPISSSNLVDTLPDWRPSCQTSEPPFCLICQTTTPDFPGITLPCLHRWCKSCVVGAYELAKKSEINWPVKCCQEQIPNDLASTMLDHPLRKALNEKLDEYETPARDRLYCSNLRCSAFIPTSSPRPSTVVCKVCGSETCTACKCLGHQGPCTASSETASILALSKRCGWQRCGECDRIVERLSGCPHILCVCGHDFCYFCAGDIKLCNGCPDRWSWRDGRRMGPRYGRVRLRDRIREFFGVDTPRRIWYVDPA